MSRVPITVINYAVQYQSIHILYFSHISWERRTDSKGRTYYADHNTRTTTWKKPTAESLKNYQQWQTQEAKNLEQRNQQHRQRFLLDGSEDANDLEDDGLGPLPEGWGELCTLRPQVTYMQR